MAVAGAGVFHEKRSVSPALFVTFSAVSLSRDELRLELVVLGRPVLFVVIDLQHVIQPDARCPIGIRLELVFAGDGRE